MHTTTTRALLAALLLLAATAPACFTEVPEAPACVSDGSILPGDVTRTNMCCDPKLSNKDDKSNKQCSELYGEKIERLFGGLNIQDPNTEDQYSGLVVCNDEEPTLSGTESGLCEISKSINMACIDPGECDGAIRQCLYFSDKMLGNLSRLAIRLPQSITDSCVGTSGCTVCAECRLLKSAEGEIREEGCADGLICTLSRGTDISTYIGTEDAQPVDEYGFCRTCDPEAIENECPPDSMGNLRTCEIVEGAPRCVVRSLVAQGDPCTTPDECDDGLTCFGSDNAKTCQFPCTLDTQEADCGELICDCGTAEASLACNPAANCKPGAQGCPTPQPSGSACFACDPTLPNPCNPTVPPAVARGCYPTDAGSAACLPEGTLSRGQTCTQPNDCKHGSTCVEVDGQRTCQILCTPEDPWRCTVSGQQCVQAGAHNICDCNPAGENQCAGTLSACMASPQGDRGFCQPPP